jgi:hypothetical protein
MPEWDFFIAYSDNDVEVAERLCDVLESHFRVFLDNRRLSPDANWKQEIPKAQRNSLITVILVSPHTNRSYFQREEIATAISMAHNEVGKNHLMLVYLNTNADKIIEKHLNLVGLHSLLVGDRFDAYEVVQALIVRLHDLLDDNNQDDSLDTAVVMNNLANYLKDKENYTSAEPLFRKTLSIY